MAGLPHLVHVAINVQDKFRGGRSESCADTEYVCAGVKSFTCPSAITGRWVAIRWTGCGTMTFCEVEVFASEYSLQSSLLAFDVFVFILVSIEFPVRRRLGTKVGHKVDVFRRESLRLASFCLTCSCLHYWSIG